MSNQTALQDLGAATIGSNKGLYLGSGMLGQLFDAVLMGVEVLMFIHWVTWARKDRLTTQVIVCLTVLFSFGVSVFNFGCLVHFFGFGFGNYALFLVPQWLGWTYMLNALVLATVQLFFLESACKLYTKSIAIFVPLLILILMALAAGIGKTVYLFTYNSGRDLTGQDSLTCKVLSHLWVGATLAIELALAGFISFGLWRSKTAWDDSDHITYKLSKITWEAQLPATLVTFVYALIRVAQSGPGIGDFFEKWYAKMFSLGLLVVLNSRFSLVKTRNNSENTWTRRNNNTTHQATVMINTETYVERSQIPPPKVGVNRQPGSPASLEDVSEDGKSPVEDLAFIHNDSSMGLTMTPEDEVKVELR